MKIGTQVIKQLLSHDNAAEVKRNKDGEVIVLEVRKKIVKVNRNMLDRR